MDYNTLQVAEENGVLVVTLNRPGSLNALNIELISELGDLFGNFRDRYPTSTAVILTGSGEKAFAAGADISEITALEGEMGVEFARKGHATMDSIESCPVPVIAAVNGYALGGGCELAMACHIRIASDNARMGLPEVSLGLIPGYGGTQRLPQIVGKGNAMRLVLTGDAIDANEAHRIGLVSQVVSPDELLPACHKIASKISSKGPLAVSAAVKSVNAAFSPAKGGFASEIAYFGELIDSSDAKEGTTAFMEKRKPQFTGK